MTAAELGLAVGMSAADATRWHPFVLESAKRFEFEAPRRLAMWVAQAAHESNSFRTLRENLNYSAAALRANWPKRFPTDELAGVLARQPELIANRVYADRLGNGPKESGDGWRYRGRGLFQVTGRANYRACGAALALDLEQHPELLETERIAALSAGWYWWVRKLSPLADAGDIEAVTRIINGGTIGLADRRARYNRALAALVPLALGAA